MGRPRNPPYVFEAEQYLGGHIYPVLTDGERLPAASGRGYASIYVTEQVLRRIADDLDEARESGVATLSLSERPDGSWNAHSAVGFHYATIERCVVSTSEGRCDAYMLSHLGLAFRDFRPRQPEAPSYPDNDALAGVIFSEDDYND